MGLNGMIINFSNEKIKTTMNQQTLQFIQINPDDFKSEIVNSILQVITKPKEEEILLTQQEVADFW